MTIITVGRTFLAGYGHAGAGAYGSDIVCAGVSTLAYTLGEAVLKLEAEGSLTAAPSVQMRSGSFEILCNPKAEAREKAEYLFRVVADGMRLIAESFPEYVSIEQAPA